MTRNLRFLVTINTIASLEAFQERGSREPVSRLKRSPARHSKSGRGEKEAILKLIRRA